MLPPVLPPGEVLELPPEEFGGIEVEPPTGGVVLRVIEEPVLLPEEQVLPPLPGIVMVPGGLEGIEAGGEPGV